MCLFLLQLSSSFIVAMLAAFTDFYFLPLFMVRCAIFRIFFFRKNLFYQAACMCMCVCLSRSFK